MQRLTTSTTQDATALSVSLPNEDMKGRLIGREGATSAPSNRPPGATLLIDETPGLAMVSCFDPVRREIARIALERIVKDGRISPGSSKTASAWPATRSSSTPDASAATPCATSACSHGRRRRRPARPASLPPSSNQNTLAHSIEVAQLLRDARGGDRHRPGAARSAPACTHLGKAIEAEAGSSHALAGASLLRRLGEDARVVNAVAAHHREVPAESLYAPLVMIADAASGSRPGARSSTLESYAQRVRRLEEIALAFERRPGGLRLPVRPRTPGHRRPGQGR
jgi:ribonuclease Y